MNDILKMPDVITKMNSFGAVPTGGNPEELARTNEADYVRLSKLIAEKGIAAE